MAGSPSRRRGSGNEIASSRPYRRGDAIRLVDWAASARLSTARGTDEFVVRDHFAEDAVRIVVVADRSPSMALFPDWLPWLHKPAAVREALRMIIASGAAANALIGSAAVGGPAPSIVPLRRDRAHGGRSSSASRARADGPPDSLDLALELARPSCAHRSRRNVRLRPLRLPPAAESGSVDRRARGRMGRRARRRPGPRLGALVSGRFGRHAPASQTPTTVRCRSIRLSRKEAVARRELNELRAAHLDDALRELELDPVRITSSERGAVHAAFLAWADGRQNRTRGYR